jgi:hypothetical protein
MKSVLILVIFWSALGFSSCAFHTAGPIDSAGAAAAGDGQLNETPKFSASIRFGAPSERVLVRAIVVEKELDRYSLSAPITLPVQLPDGMVISLVLPASQSLQGPIRAEVRASASQSDVTAPMLPVAQATLVGTQDGKTSVDIHVFGLKSILEQGAESQAWLSVSIYDHDLHRAYHIQFRVLTPPSQVTFEQMTWAQYAAVAHSKFDAQFVHLDALNAKYSLLQVLRVKNRSKETVTVTFPKRLKGGVSGQVSAQRPIKEQCSYTWGLTSENLEVSPSISLYPLVLELPNTFLTYQDQIRISLEPNQEALVGIYGEGVKCRTYVDQGPGAISWALPPENVARGCDYACANFHEMEKYLDNYGCRTVGTPGCSGPISCLDCSRSGIRCKECFEQDGKVAPEDFYKRGCNGDWHVSPKLAVVNSFAGRTPISLTIDASMLQAKLRYGFSSESDDPEFRMQPALSASSVQWE